MDGLFGPGSKSHPVTVLDGIKNKLGSDAQVTLVAGPKPSKVYPGMRVGETTEATVDVTNAGSVAAMLSHRSIFINATVRRHARSDNSRDSSALLFNLERRRL